MIQYPDRQIHDLGELLPGDVVDVWQHRTLHCTGSVEETAPQFGVLWVREAGNGARRLISATDHRLSRHMPYPLPEDPVALEPPAPPEQHAEARWAW